MLLNALSTTKLRNIATGTIRGLFLWALIEGIGASSGILAGLAQPITPAADGTGTIVIQNGNQFEIQGGARSQDGGNLFHSFEQFSIPTGEIANFLSAPEINNILGRVVGGNASFIDGLIQVTGGNANLFLMNPAGIVFGSNASLNVPGDFWATTATGIGFGEGNWFEAIGSSDYENLVGDPDRFAFDLVNSGAIVNGGNLAVNAGQSLTLLAGNTINTGTLSAPTGTINLTAVPGTNLVRLSRESSILNLEFAPPRDRTGEILPFSPLALPELLTGTDLETGVEVIGDRPRVNGTNLPTGTGVAIASGSLDVSGAVGGWVNVLGDRVGAIAATIDASGTDGGGTIRFGGEQQGQGTIPNASRIYISPDSQLLADATEMGDGGRIITFAADRASIHGSLSARGGAFRGDGGFIETSGLVGLNVTSLPDISASAGMGGEWLIDPYNIEIVPGFVQSNINLSSPFTAIGDDAQIGIDLIVAALNSGDVAISTGIGGTQDGNITWNAPLNFDLAMERTLTLSASGTIWLRETIDGTPTSAPLNIVLNGGNSSSDTPGIRIQDAINSKGGDITMVGISDEHRGIWIQEEIRSESGDIVLDGRSQERRGIFLTDKLNSGSGNIDITGSSQDARSVSINDAIASGGGNISIAGLIGDQGGVAIQGEMTSAGGNISITGASNAQAGIRVEDEIDAGTGDITLNADGLNLFSGSELNGSGNLTVQPLTPTLDLRLGGTGGTGAIFLTDDEVDRINNGFNAITIGRSDGSGTIVIADDITFRDPVTLRAPNGTGAIDATAGTIIGTNDATITLEAGGNITTEDIINPGRDVTIISNTGSITTGAIDTSSTSGNGGNVSLEALQDVEVTSINTASTAGQGGEISVAAKGYFRATGTFVADGKDFSIYSDGSGGSGQITLNHGGSGATPFIIGDASTNGIAGAIGDSAIAIVPYLSLYFTYIDGQVEVVTVEETTAAEVPIIEGVEMLEVDVTETESIRNFSSLIAIDGILGKTTTDLLLEVLQETISQDISQLDRLGTVQGDRITLSVAPLGSRSSLITELKFETIDRYFTRAFEGYLAAETGNYASTPTKSLGNNGTNNNSADNAEIAESNPAGTSEVEEESDREVPIAVARDSLDRVERATGVKPSIIYAIYAPALGFSSLDQPPQATDQLYLLLVTAKTEPILYKTGISRSQVEPIAAEFRRNITNRRRKAPNYLDAAQQLYQWLVAPLEADLEKHDIDHLTFILDAGLRSLPIAALHDGDGFIIERYSVSLMPSLSLSDLSYTDVRDLEVLAMGSSEFSDLEPLPAVPIELDLLSSGKLWQGKAYLNEDFTLDALQTARDRTPYRMIHLATHSDFRPGSPADSYIRVGGERLRMDRLRELGWHDPAVELLVLSACRTALGDSEAELGFAGIAAMAGVKSTLGSLWRINDIGSLGFMSAFYEQLQTAPIKAQAVRRAQLAMLNGDIRFENNRLMTLSTEISLDNADLDSSDRDFTHPYYWSSFTLIGTPW